MQKLHYKVHTSVKSLQAITPEWKALCKQTYKNTASFFNLPSFQLLNWEIFKEGTLCVIEFRNIKNELIGIAPLQLVNKVDLIFLSSPLMTDYLDFVYQNSYLVQILEILENIALENSFNFSLKNIHESSLLLNAAQKVFQPSAWNVEVLKKGERVNLDLQKSWEAFLIKLKSKHRKELVRILKNTANPKRFEVRILSSHEEISKNLPFMFKLIKSSNEVKKEYLKKNILLFIKRLFEVNKESDLIQLAFFYIDNEVAAGGILFNSQDTLSYYISGYNPKKFREFSPGNVLASKLIQYAILQKKSHFDFMRGNEQYKDRFEPAHENMYSLTIVKKRFINRLSYQVTHLTKGKVSKKKKILIISPHLDDGVFSCTDHILNFQKKGFQVELLTVFTSYSAKNLSDDMKYFMKKTGFVNTNNLEAARKKEDKQALALLNLRTQQLNMIDGGFREVGKKPVYPNFDTLFSGQLSKSDDIFFSHLIASFKQIVNNYDLVLIPYGLGRHIDHLLVRWAVEKVADSTSLGYYLDIPYLHKRKNFSQTLLFDFLRYKKSILMTSELKRIAMGKYESQFPLYFKDGFDSFPEILFLK